MTCNDHPLPESTPKDRTPSVSTNGMRLSLVAVVALLAVAAVGVGFRPTMNYDIWRNLTVGQWIAVTHDVPHQDMFTFTETGKPWIDYEWLSELAFWFIHRFWGYPGLIVYQSLLVWATGICLLLMLRTRAPVPGWFLLIPAIPAIWLSEFHILVRPHLHSLALAPLYLWWVWRPRKWRDPGIVLLFCLWANLHSGTLGILLLAVSLVGGIPSSGRIRAVVAAALGLLINPYSWRIVLPLVRVLSAQSDGGVQVTEWMPLPFNQMIGFWVYLTISAVLLIVPGRTHRRWDAVMLVAFGVLSAKAVRMAPFLTLMAVPGNAEALWRLAGRRYARLGSWAAACAAVVVSGVLLARHVPLSPAPDPRACPEAAASYVDARGLQIRCFNDMHQGAYLMWRWFPDRTIYMDNRTELFVDLAATERAACQDAASFKVFLDGYDITGAVLDYPWTVEGNQTATYYPLFRFFGWQVVAWDDGGVLLLAPRAGYDSLLAADSYRVLDPFIVDPPQHMMTTPEREALLQESRRALQRTPASARAWQIWGNISTAANRPATALHAYETVSRLNPKDPDTHARMALTLEKLGRYDDAEKHWKTQASRGLDLPVIWFNLGRLSLIAAKPEEARLWLAKATGGRPDEKSWQGLLTFARSATEAQLQQQQRALQVSAAEQMRTAVAAMEAQEWTTAQGLLAESIAAVPHQAGSHQNLGACLANQGLWEQAEAEFREALTLDPSLGWARYNLAGLLVAARQDTPAARAALDTLISAEPDTHLLALASRYRAELSTP